MLLPRLEILEVERRAPLTYRCEELVKPLARQERDLEVLDPRALQVVLDGPYSALVRNVDLVYGDEEQRVPLLEELPARLEDPYLLLSGRDRSI